MAETGHNKEIRQLIKIGHVIINLDNVCRIERRDSARAEIFFVDGTSKEFEGDEAKKLMENFRYLT